MRMQYPHSRERTGADERFSVILARPSRARHVLYFPGLSFSFVSRARARALISEHFVSENLLAVLLERGTRDTSLYRATSRALSRCVYKFTRKRKQMKLSVLSGLSVSLSIEKTSTRDIVVGDFFFHVEYYKLSLSNGRRHEARRSRANFRWKREREREKKRARR